MSGVSESAHILGRYENVFLTEAEVAELQADFPTVWQEYIERLSEYIPARPTRATPPPFAAG